tara:strand:- start:188 stop:310 length:123 start_codon:yes stop_codon:yes gene_type:complete
MRKFKKQKEPSYWDVMGGLERFMIMFLTAVLGFFIWIVVT